MPCLGVGGMRSGGWEDIYVPDVAVGMPSCIAALIKAKHHGCSSAATDSKLGRWRFCNRQLLSRYHSAVSTGVGDLQERCHLPLRGCT